jgi:hypothetical protein
VPEDEVYGASAVPLEEVYGLSVPEDEVYGARAVPEEEVND